MQKKLKITNDVVFQRIFGKVGNERFTKKLLERILGIKIEDLTLDTNKRLIGENIDDKTGRIDVKVKLSDGTKVIIEMQVARYEYMAERLLYYWAQSYAGDLKKGEEYKELRKTIAILISVEELERLREIEGYHTKWQIREENHLEMKLTNDLEIHVIELGKFKEGEKGLEESEWIRFIRGDKINMERDLDKELKEAIEELERITADPKTRELYYQREKDLRDKISFAGSERRAGIEQGKKETQIQIILNMHKKHMEIDEICEIVSLSREKVASIINEAIK